MSQKPILMLVDNREESHAGQDGHSNAFKSSGFKSTEIDPIEQKQVALKEKPEHFWLSQLNDRVNVLEQRIRVLENRSKSQKISKRIRRRANQINRDYQCPHDDCGKFYGSDTSLKNHLKLKHFQKS